MKRIFFFTWLGIISLIFLGCHLAGCSTGDSPKENLRDWIHAQGKLKVLSTTAMVGDLVRQVGGEYIASLCLIKGDVDPHSYELVKGDDEKIQFADLIFYNGLGLEHSVSIQCHLEGQEKAIPLGQHILEKNAQRLVRVGGQIDPHIWMDMDLFSEVIDPIVEALAKRDPAHRDYFVQSGEKVKNQLKAKDRELRQKMERIPSKRRFLVTSHDAFHYFTRRYLSLEEGEAWQERVRAPEGLAPEGQLSVLDIQKVSDFLCRAHIRVVFPESNMNPDALKKIVNICRKRGHEVKVAEVPLYGDSMAGAGSYIEMMEHNVDTFIHFNLAGESACQTK